LPSSASGQIIGIHGVREERQHVMTRMREEVSARMPRPEESRLLYLRPGVPVE
jgi:GntR family transcriptional regulator